MNERNQDKWILLMYLPRASVSVSYVNAGVTVPFLSPFTIHICSTVLLSLSRSSFCIIFSRLFADTLISEGCFCCFFFCMRLRKSVHIRHNACSGLSAFHLNPFNSTNSDYNALKHTHMAQYITIYCLLNFHSARYSASLLIFFFKKRWFK